MAGFTGFGGGFGGFGSRPVYSRPEVDQRSRLAQLSPEERAILIQSIQQANLVEPPQDQGGESIVGRFIPDIAEDAATQIGKSLLYSPVGLFNMGKAAVQDVGDLVTEGDVTPERLGEIGKAIPAQIVQDFMHPRENIGYLLMDIAGIASLGAGTAARGAAAAGKFQELNRLRRGLDEPPPPAPIGYPPRPPRGPQELPGENVPSRSGYPEDIADLGPPQETRGAAPVDVRSVLSREQAEKHVKWLEGRAESISTGELRQHVRQLRERGWSLEILEGDALQDAVNTGGREWVLRNKKDGRRKPSTPLDKYLDDVESGAVKPPVKKELKSSTAPKEGVKDPQAYVSESHEVELLPRGEIHLKIDPDHPNRIWDEESGWSMVKDPARPVWQLYKGEKKKGDPIGDPEGQSDHLRAMKTAKENLEMSIREERSHQPLSLLSAEADPIAAGNSPEARVARAVEHKKEELAAKEAPPAPKKKAEPKSPAMEELDAEVAKTKAAKPKAKESDIPTTVGTMEGATKAYKAKPGETIPPSGRNFSPRAAGVSDRQLGIAPRQMGKQMPDVPREKQLQIASEIRLEARAKGGKLSPQKEFAILKKHLGSAELAKEVMKRRREIRGGADIPIETLIRETLRAFAGPRLPGVMRMETYDRLTDEGRQRYAQDPDTYHAANALLSRNPLVRSIQRAQYGGQQRLQGKTFRGAQKLERTIGLGRNLEKTIKFHENEAQRVIKAAEDAGLPQTIREAVTQALNQEREHGIGPAVDTMNQIAKIGTLYLKPAYVPANMLGQIFFSLADHAWNPVNVARTVKIQRQLYKDYHGDRGRRAQQRAGRMRAVMGEGLAHAMHHEAGMSRKIGSFYRLASEGFNKILDTPFRDNAFINEAYRFGYRSADEIGDLLDAVPGSKKYDDLIEIGRRANRNLVDYARLGSKEKAWIRRVIFFYPWFKGATIYAGHYVSEHPAQALLNLKLGQEAYENDPLEGAPSYMEGFIKWGEKEVPGVGKVARVINPTSSSVLGTPAEVIGGIQNFVGGGGGRSENASSFLTPPLSAGIAAVTGSDPFTGRDVPPGQSPIETFAREMGDTVAPLKMWQNVQRGRAIASGEQNPEDLMYVRTPWESVQQWGLGVTPVSVNESEMRERGAAESRSLESKRRRTELNLKDKLGQWEEQSKAVGLDIPESVREAFQLRVERDGELAALDASKKGDLRMIDRLQGEMALLVRKGVMDEQAARDILLRYALLDDSAIESLRRRLADEFFGGNLLSAWGSQVRARGGELSRL